MSDNISEIVLALNVIATKLNNIDDALRYQSMAQSLGTALVLLGIALGLVAIEKQFGRRNA